MKTEVLIATRRDPDLRATVDNIKQNSGCYVTVHEDERGAGPQAIRHKLIRDAVRADVVIVMDGHMRIRKGTLDAAAEYVGARGNKVACLRCFHSEREDWTGTPYAGATLQWSGKGKDAGEPQAFVAKWRKSQDAGKIGAVMGACYVMRRDWYMDGLRAPWQWGQGWGCDEELLSAATWLRGGEVELLPWAVWHRVQSANTRKYKQTPEQTWGVWANRIQLLQMLPMPQSERNPLMRRLICGLSREQWIAAAKLADAKKSAAMEYRAFLADGGLDWGDFCTEIMEKETVKMASMMEMREQARAFGLTVPFGCKKVELRAMLDDFRKTESPEQVPEPEPMEVPKRPRANWGPGEYNNLKARECVHCGGLHTEVVGVRHIGKLTIRQRMCKACFKPFPTRELVGK